MYSIACVAHRINGREKVDKILCKMLNLPKEEEEEEVHWRTVSFYIEHFGIVTNFCKILNHRSVNVNTEPNHPLINQFMLSSECVHAHAHIYSTSSYTKVSKQTNSFDQTTTRQMLKVSLKINWFPSFIFFLANKIKRFIVYLSKEQSKTIWKICSKFTFWLKALEYIGCIYYVRCWQE